MTDNQSQGKRSFYLLGISFISAAVLVLEVSMTRIFSFILWYHYAFMMITVALLGFGASGIFLMLSKKMRSIDLRFIGIAGAALFSVSTIMALLVVSQLPFDPSRLGKEWSALVLLVVNFLALTIPFFFAGLIIAAVISRRSDIVNQVYFLDLVGGGTGCLATIALFSFLGGQGMVFLAAVLGMCAAFLFSINASRMAVWSSAAATVVIAVLMFFAGDLIPLYPMPTKSLMSWLDKSKFPHSKLVFTGWNAYSRIDVVEDTKILYWLYNPAFPRFFPPTKQIVIDGDAATTVMEGDIKGSRAAFLSVIPSSLPYEWFRPEKALIIGSGGGVDISSAIVNDVREIDAVEMNPLIVDLMMTRYAEASGNIYSRSGVQAHLKEGRNFIRNSPNRYGLIQLTLIDTWAALSSGAYSLSENYLYTVEAFEDYYDHLSPGGVIAITRWYWNPPLETLRLCSIGMKALESRGAANPRDHFAIYTMGVVSTVVISRDPLSRSKMDQLYVLCGEKKFDVIYDPYMPHATPLEALFSGGDREEYIRRAPYDITPSYDDKPFFFQFTRWGDLNIVKAFQRNPFFSTPGRLILVIIFLLSLLFSFAFILLPLLLGRKQDLNARAGFPYLFYFFGIGISFMLLEIYFMQKFNLLLGHPVYSLSLVLFSLLVFSGIGSLLSKKIIRGSYKRLGAAILVLSCLIVLLSVSLPTIFFLSLGTPFFVRVLLTLAILFPPGFLMGLPFPSGISFAGRMNAGVIPWLWAMNSFASVISSSLCVLIAIEFGFMIVALISSLGYLTAYLGLGLSQR